MTITDQRLKKEWNDFLDHMKSNAPKGVRATAVSIDEDDSLKTECLEKAREFIELIDTPESDVDKRISEAVQAIMGGFLARQVGYQLRGIST